MCKILMCLMDAFRCFFVFLNAPRPQKRQSSELRGFKRILILLTSVIKSDLFHSFYQDFIQMTSEEDYPS